MALPRQHQSSFTPREIEFLAGNETITIIPTVKLPKLDFIQGTIGPFQPPLKSTVPVWLALLMKRNNLCTVVPPEWLTVENLTSKLEDEQTEPEFSQLPFRYMELSHMLLEVASTDIPNAEQVRRLLKDLRETRQAKTRLGIQSLDDESLMMNNMSLMEINEIRPLFIRAFNEMRKLRQAEDT
ncbi:dna replication complex gins protein psf2 [Lichtheimia corymbifera JMRC:FSU:9682]|uniref:DNA replication complex GINS protein PSF2 n=1 Tax=Lichtheimia corymbifera JMRC:FSU:9682 TaxID=1263082 RepID=A0A068SBD6_9FUNG|nr:dna replication complex gins protein psf2 [Lichtheimia corymbifera JMRC:FSU:9682]